MKKLFFRVLRKRFSKRLENITYCQIKDAFFEALYYFAVGVVLVFCVLLFIAVLIWVVQTENFWNI